MKFSTKRLLVIKANTQVIIIISGAVAIATFSLIASRALLNQQSYQGRVIDKKSKALVQIKKNVDAVTKLKTAYSSFQNETVNVIGGKAVGVGSNDGDNAKIVLDALPSKYDFPAFASSIEKVYYSSPLFKLESFGGGTDDEIGQLGVKISPKVAPVDMNFSMSFSGNHKSILAALDTLQRSIRPIKITALQLGGSDDQMTMSVTAKTYYQPGIVRSTKTEVIK